MISERNAPRFLGAAFLFVVFASITSGTLLMSAVGSSSMSDMLVNVSNQVTLMQLSVLFEMVNSSGIIVLASLLYIVLSKHNHTVARIAWGWWLAEAIVLTLSSTGAFALIPLSQDFVKAGTPVNSFYQSLGQVLYDGVYKHSYSGIHMWFYCIGGMLWYSLFYRSKYIPRAISLFGLIAVIAAFGAVLLGFLGNDVPMLVSLPLLPFELTIGTWLVLKGIDDRTETVPNRQTLPVGGNS